MEPQIGFMANHRQHHKPTSHRRVKPTPDVEMIVPKQTFDVNAWLGNFTERKVDREVHLLADKVVRADDESANHSGQSGKAETTEDRTSEPG